ncbi:hypothetical protein T492DRAFT_885219 [Pavlovales sp. CCMP2436]|nr:hypothetical protein T492DRAFT_885219 [Pavlovales sp. CCMP2436]
MKEKESAQKLARDAQVREVHLRKDAHRLVGESADREILARIRAELSHERVHALAHRMQGTL